MKKGNFPANQNRAFIALGSLATLVLAACSARTGNDPTVTLGMTTTPLTTATETETSLLTTTASTFLLQPSYPRQQGYLAPIFQMPAGING